MGKPAISRPAPAVGYADGPEEFLWDGLALVRRGATGYLNEPHANGGSPLLSSGGGVLFNDLLGSTLGTLGGDGYRPVSLTAFGDTEDAGAFFTGKPLVDGLGYAFLLRSYRPDHGKWLTADPLGYPDGWNNLAYCRNDGIEYIDVLGGFSIGISFGFTLTPVSGYQGSLGLIYDTSSEKVYFTASTGVGVGWNASLNVSGTFSPENTSEGISQYVDVSGGAVGFSGTYTKKLTDNSSSFSAGYSPDMHILSGGWGGSVTTGGVFTKELFDMGAFVDACADFYATMEDYMIDGWDWLADYFSELFTDNVSSGWNFE